jgi:hypothetical protein
MKVASDSKMSFSFSEPAIYQLKVVGELQQEWSAKLKGMQIIVKKEKTQKPTTILTGQMNDQAELSSVLHTLYHLHLTVISVKMLK